MERVPTGRILLVEDNPAHARLVMLPLRRRGVQVDWAPSGEQALSRLESDADDPAGATLVLLDLRMPGLNGFDVLDHVRRGRGCRHLPIIVLTTSGETSDIEEAYRRGANAYLVKPTDFDELDRILACVVDFWLIHNQAPCLQ